MESKCVLDLTLSDLKISSPNSLIFQTFIHQKGIELGYSSIEQQREVIYEDPDHKVRFDLECHLKVKFTVPETLNGRRSEH